jgi:uncharacterized membrane-anchored protein YhcB (DUF1043 family)
MTENARDIVQAEEQGGLEEELKSVLKDLGLKPSELRKYFKAAKRLRELERQYGKSYKSYSESTRRNSGRASNSSTK